MSTQFNFKNLFYVFFITSFIILITSESIYGFDVVSPPIGEPLTSDTVIFTWNWHDPDEVVWNFAFETY